MDGLGCSPTESCIEGIKGSRLVYSINTERGLPICLLGVANHPGLEDTGVVWTMSSNKVSRYPLAFVRAVRELLETACGLYSKIISYADNDNPKHKKFHEVLGMINTGETYTKQDLQVYAAYEYMTVKGLNKLYYNE